VQPAAAGSPAQGRPEARARARAAPEVSQAMDPESARPPGGVHSLARCLAAVEHALAHPDAAPYAQPVRPVARATWVAGPGQGT